MITINELFSGIGAQVAALKRLGVEYETVGISEIDRYAMQSYEAINGKNRNYGDISKVEALDYADLWTYSFPCTDISFAGKQKGLTDETGKQTRSGLLFEVERLLKKSVDDGTQPKYLLLENVKNLVGKKFKPDFDKWLKTLDSLGYNNYWKVLNAKDYGVPQNRERVFVVSIRKDVDGAGYIFPEPFKLERRLKDVLETNVDEKFYLKDELVKKFVEHLKDRDVSNSLTTVGKDNLEVEPRIRVVGNIYGNHQAGRVYDKDKICPTLDCMSGGNREPKIIEDGCAKLDRHSPSTGVTANQSIRIRKLTPKECWRLMDFTDEEFEAAKKAGVSKTQLCKQAGNSIVVSVLAAVFKNIFLKGRF